MRVKLKHFFTSRQCSRAGRHILPFEPQHDDDQRIYCRKEKQISRPGNKSGTQSNSQNSSKKNK